MTEGLNATHNYVTIQHTQSFNPHELSKPDNI